MSSQTLPKEARIPKRKEIQRLQRLAKKIHTKSFIIVYQPNRLSFSRLAVTVSKKVDKRAVVRNKIKRRIREIFRRQRGFLNGSFDLVIIARSSAKEWKFDEYARQIIGALRFHKLLLPPPPVEKSPQEGSRS